MTPRDIERFFSALSRAWPHRTDIILIGGGVAVLEGSTRPTFDLDFEFRLAGPPAPEDADVFAGAVRQAEAASGVEGQFTTDIGSWSPIALPPWRNSARRWKCFGAITVKRLDPAVYVVTKLRRGSSGDFADLILVARRHHVPWKNVARLCGTATRLSPSSTSLLAFTRRVMFLFREHGRDVWGPGFDPARAAELFRRNSGRRRTRSSRG